MEELIQELKEAADRIDSYHGEIPEEVVLTISSTFHTLSALLDLYRNGDKELLNIFLGMLDGFGDELTSELQEQEEKRILDLERFKRLLSDVSETTHS